MQPWAALARLWQTAAEMTACYSAVGPLLNPSSQIQELFLMFTPNQLDCPGKDTGRIDNYQHNLSITILGMCTKHHLTIRQHSRCSFRHFSRQYFIMFNTLLINAWQINNDQITFELQVVINEASLWHNQIQEVLWWLANATHTEDHNCHAPHARGCLGQAAPSNMLDICLLSSAVNESYWAVTLANISIVRCYQQVFQQ